MKLQPRVLVVALATVGIFPATLAARTNTAPRPECPKTFNLKMFQGALDVIYAGTRTPKHGAYGHLWHYVHCQRKKVNQTRARKLWGERADAWTRRRAAARQAQIAASMHSAKVSWYDDAGPTASGFHSYYGVADCANYTVNCYPFGTKVQFCYHGCQVAVADDHGPYIGGRDWDLNQNTAGAIGVTGCGVCTVTWRIVQ